MIYTSPAYAQCGVAVLQEPPAFTANKGPEKRIVDKQFNVSNQHSVCWTGFSWNNCSKHTKKKSGEPTENMIELNPMIYIIRSWGFNIQCMIGDDGFLDFPKWLNPQKWGDVAMLQLGHILLTSSSCRTHNMGFVWKLATLKDG